MTREPSDSRIAELQREVANGILAKIKAAKRSGPVSVAIGMIMGRLTASGDSLAVLHSNSPHDYRFDAASILRTMYDVMLQGLYVLSEASKCEERAKLYLGFMDIERKQRIDLFDSSDTDLARQVSGSPKRSSAEPEIERRFNAIKQDYETKKGGLRKKWFPGTLKDLAIATGLEPEYMLMQRFLSGVTHSSPLTLKQGPCASVSVLINWSWRFAFRMLGAYAEFERVGLNETEEGLVNHARRNIFSLRATRELGKQTEADR